MKHALLTGLFGGALLANTRSAQKHIRADEKKRIRNLKVRSRVKTLIKKAERSVLNGDPDTVDALRIACSELDKAASKGVIHRNNAARRKSRLMAKFNKANAAVA
jgi:small subunit ribosomal protein S20